MTNRTIHQIFSNIEANAGSLSSHIEGMASEGDHFLLASIFRERIEGVLSHLDEEISKVLQDEGERTLWACRMPLCRAKIRTLTMNLAFWGKPEWSWKEVLGAIAHLCATTEAAERVLALIKARSHSESTA